MARGKARKDGYVPGHAYDAVKRSLDRADAEAAGTAAPLPRAGSLEERIDRYRPRKTTATEWDRVRGPVVDAAKRVAAVHAMSDHNAERLLRFLSALALWWTVTLGQRLDLSRMLSADSIQAFAKTSPVAATWERRSLQTCRSELRRAAHTLGVPNSRYGHGFGAATRLPAYSPREKRAHYKAARSLPEPWRTEAVLLLDLTYGAGLDAGECAVLRGDQVEPLLDGCALEMAERKSRGTVRPARTVFVVGPAGKRIDATARENGPGVLIRPGRADVDARVGLVASKISSRPGAVPFRASRASSAWAVDLLQRVPFRVVADLAGWGDACKAPAQLLGSIPPLDDDDRLAHLRRAARADRGPR